MNRYRVWMKDGYATMHNADDEDDAKRQAVKAAENNIKGCVMTPKERRDALIVDRVVLLSEAR